MVLPPYRRRLVLRRGRPEGQNRMQPTRDRSEATCSANTTTRSRSSGKATAARDLGYRAYGREHVVRAAGKPHDIDGSSDRVFHGDRDALEPRGAADRGAQPVPHALLPARRDAARRRSCTGTRMPRRGTMVEDGRGGGVFTEAHAAPARRSWPTTRWSRRPERIHAEAAEKCFIAASVAFPVHHEPITVVTTVSA